MHSTAHTHTSEAELWNAMAERYGTRATLATTLDATNLPSPLTPAKQTLNREMLEAALDSMSDSGCAAVPPLAASLHRASVWHRYTLFRACASFISSHDSSQKCIYGFHSADAWGHTPA